MKNPKTSEPRAWVVFGTASGVALGAGAILAIAGRLSPLAAADRPALALFAVCLSLPLGAALGRAARPCLGGAVRVAGVYGAAALLAGVLMAVATSGADPALLVRTASWCAAGCLLGASLQGVARGVGIVATLAWLGLCALPFICGSLGSWREVAEGYALQGCPWLGFSQDAFGGDPLRRSVIYLGKWSSLEDKPAFGLLSAAELWVAAALGLAAYLLRTGLARETPPVRTS